MKKRIVERPNFAISKLIDEVYHQAKRGNKPSTNNMYVRVMPSLVDIEIKFEPEEADNYVMVDNPVTEKEVEEEEPETSDASKEEILQAINKAEKHKELKQIAKKYGLDVKSNLRHPEALRKDLIAQVEGE